MESRAELRPGPDQTMTDERLDALERWRDDMDKRFADAFPGGDHVGHCRYHVLMIEEIDSRKRLTQAVKEKTISGLAWAVVVVVGISMWSWIKAQLKG